MKKPQMTTLSFGLLLASAAVIASPAFADSFGVQVGSFGPIPAYSNGFVGNNSKTDNYVTHPFTGISTRTGLEWQCVELMHRFYIQFFGIDLPHLGTGNADQYGTAAAASAIGLVFEPNGSANFLRAGDLLVSVPGNHVAVAKKVTETSVCVIQQNFNENSGDDEMCIARAGNTLAGFSKTLPITGWLHRGCSGGTLIANATLPAGTFVQGMASGEISLMTGDDSHSARMPIANPEALRRPYWNGLNYDQFDFANVVLVPQTYYSAIPVTGVLSVAGQLPGNGRPLPDGSLIRNGKGEISLVSGGKRRPFASADDFSNLGFKFCNVLAEVQYDNTNVYPVGTILRTSGGVVTTGSTQVAPQFQNLYTANQAAFGTVTSNLTSATSPTGTAYAVQAFQKGAIYDVTGGTSPALSNGFLNAVTWITGALQSRYTKDGSVQKFGIPLTNEQAYPAANDPVWQWSYIVFERGFFWRAQSGNSIYVYAYTVSDVFNANATWTPLGWSKEQ